MKAKPLARVYLIDGTPLSPQPNSASRYFLLLTIVWALHVLVALSAKAELINFDGAGYADGQRPPTPWTDVYEYHHSSTNRVPFVVEAGKGVGGSQALSVYANPFFEGAAVYLLSKPYSVADSPLRISVKIDPPKGITVGAWNFLAYGGVGIGNGWKQYDSDQARGITFKLEDTSAWPESNKIHPGDFKIISSKGYLETFVPDAGPNYYEIAFDLDATWETVTYTIKTPNGQTYSNSGPWEQGEIDKIWLWPASDDFLGQPVYYDDIQIGEAGPVVSQVPVITSSTNANGTVGLAFTYQITASNNPTGFGAAGLPGGLTIDTVTGLISGAPTVGGTFSVSLSATNAAGAGTAILSLAIGYPPLAITNGPQVLAIQSGQVAIFKVGATGQVALAYQWRKNGTNLVNTERISGVNTAQLNLCPVQAQDAGEYSVVVSQAGQSVVSDAATLFVDLALPVIARHPQALSCNAGETALFSAAVSGEAPLSCRWRRNGMDLVDNERITGATTPTLTLAEVTVADTGWYSLAITNAAGTVSSNPARLTVHATSNYAAALNFDTGTWTSGGNLPWIVQSDITHDGTNAAQSGPIGHSQYSFLETTVYGPGDFSFYWKVSSEDSGDYLNVMIDSSLRTQISGQVDWALKTYHLNWGPHPVRWEYQKDGSVSVGLDAGWVDQVAFVPTRVVSLEMALEPIPLPLRTYGDAPWFGQENINHDGSSAARNGYISHSQSSTLETTVVGPGTISFYWKVSSEESADLLLFRIDGIEWAGISGEVDWGSRVFHLPWGIHTVSWRYRKDASVNVGADAGWVDQVTFTPVQLFSLQEAADNSKLLWTTGGHLPWFGQGKVAHDGANALQSGPVAANQSSILYSAVTGPGTLSFYWKVSSEEGGDPLAIYIDEVEKNSISGEADWRPRTYVIRPGAHALQWRYSKDSNIDAGADAGWVDQVTFASAPALPVALNSPELVWTPGGAASWFPEMVTTHDGIASARSGDISHNQSVTLETIVTGPGTLSFYWKVSSEEGGDSLIFSLDDVEQGRISGEVDWRQRNHSITAGTHTLKWRYEKDYSVNAGADAGWVDEVRFVPEGMVPPVITSATNAIGTVGQPFSYQITATNNPNYYNATGLPPGLALDANIGLITGTPTEAGTNTITLQAGNPAGTGTMMLTIVIGPRSVAGAGSLDATFNAGAGADGDVLAIALQSDGKAVIGGRFTSFNGTPRHRIARLNADGSLDAAFDPGTGADDLIWRIAVQTDGKAVVAGEFTTINGVSRNYVARLNANGSLETGFDALIAEMSSGAYVEGLAIQPDGKILIGGSFTNVRNTPCKNLARLNSDGSLDTRFDPGLGANKPVLSIAPLADGKVLISGWFTEINGTPRNYLARLHANGSLDTSFTSSITEATDSRINSVAPAAESKLLINGIFTYFNSTSRNNLARLNPDGSLDTAFNPSAGPNDQVLSVFAQADGKLLIGGVFTTFNGTPRNRIARLNSDGNLDTSFDPGTGANDWIRPVVIQSDGRIWIGGAFTRFNGTPQNRIARLLGQGEIPTVPSRLNIQLLSGNQVLVSWPTNTTGFVLETVASLSPNADWQAITGAPVAVGLNFVVTHSATSGNQFYRLKKPL